QSRDLLQPGLHARLEQGARNYRCGAGLMTAVELSSSFPQQFGGRFVESLPELGQLAWRCCAVSPGRVENPEFGALHDRNFSFVLFSHKILIFAARHEDRTRPY